MKTETPIEPEQALDILSDFYKEAPDVLKELYHRLPYGQQFKTSSGRPFHFGKFVEPRLDHETGRWKFGVDAIFDDGKSPDHFEFFVNHTGGGGFAL